jgi:alkaline phosphatase D
MVVEYDTTDRFANDRRIVGPTATDATDFTSRVDMAGLPAGQNMFVRVKYVNLNNQRIESETLSGQFRPAPAYLTQNAGRSDVVATTSRP